MQLGRVDLVVDLAGVDNVSWTVQIEETLRM